MPHLSSPSELEAGSLVISKVAGMRDRTWSDGQDKQGGGGAEPSRGEARKTAERGRMNIYQRHIKGRVNKKYKKSGKKERKRTKQKQLIVGEGRDHEKSGRINKK